MYTQSGSPQQRADLGCQRRAGRIRGRRARTENELPARGHTSQLTAYRLAQSPFDAVAHDGPADTLADREADPRRPRWFRLPCPAKRQQPPADGTAAPADAREVERRAHALAAPKALVRRNTLVILLA